MANQILRDARGRVLGMIEMKPANVQDARDVNGRYLGSYDPNTNITKDERGRAIGTGNLLGTLLRCDSSRKCSMDSAIK